MAIFGDGGLDYTYEALKNEKQRQGIINLGLDQINAIFGGGTVPFYSPVTDKYSHDEWKTGGGRSTPFYSLGKQGAFKPFSANAKTVSPGSYFVKDQLNFLTPEGLLNQLHPTKGITSAIKRKDPLGILTAGLFSMGAKPPGPRQMVNRQIGKNNLFTGSEQTFEGFQPSFYDEREKAYLDYAMPQLGEQYRSNRDAILYGLANRGVLGGSVQNKAASDLNRATGRAKQTLADTAIGQSQELKKSVEQARQDAIAKLYTSGRPSETVQSVISTAGGFRAPSTFAPVIDLFDNLAKQYYTNLLYNNYRPSGGGNYGAEDYSLPSASISFGD